MIYNKILVPLDGSTLAECSLKHIKAIASGCGVGEIILLTVTEEVTMWGTQWMSSQEQVNRRIDEVDKTREMVKTKAAYYLEKVSENLKQSGFTVRTEIIEERGNQHPADVILDYADNNNVDLIVITTHGRSGISRWAFGSEAEKVVRYSKVPVLTITPIGCRDWTFLELDAKSREIIKPA